MIGFPLIIYRSPLPHTYTLSFLHRHPESFRPVTSAPTHYYNPYSHLEPVQPLYFCAYMGPADFWEVLPGHLWPQIFSHYVGPPVISVFCIH